MSQRKNNIEKKRVTIWWVDDDFLDIKSDNTKLFKKLEKSDYINARKYSPREFEVALAEAKKGPDLFLVDYRLNIMKDPVSGKRFPYTGTGLVGQIRDKYPEYPVYLVSKILTENDIEKDNVLFDRLMSYSWFQEKGQETARRVLRSDAEDYRSIRAIRNRNSFTPINNLLKSPKSAQEDVFAAAPDSLKKGIGSLGRGGQVIDKITFRSSGVIQLAQWIRRDLIQHPGILYSDLYAATSLGMTLSYFLRIFLSRLSDASEKDSPLYKGVFSCTESRRWWKKSIIQFLFSLPEAKDSAVEDPWIAGHKILGLSKTNMPRCFVCNEYYPETVGCDPDNKAEMHPVHWRCSDADESMQLQPHYDQIRLFRD